MWLFKIKKKNEFKITLNLWNHYNKTCMGYCESYWKFSYILKTANYILLLLKSESFSLLASNANVKIHAVYLTIFSKHSFENLLMVIIKK